MNNNDLNKLLLKKLLDISSELQVKKCNVNQFGGFNYRSLEDIYESLKPLLKKNGCYIVFNDNIELIGDRYYYVSECRFYSYDIGTDIYISTKGYARESLNKAKMDEAQITGSCSSYAKKYAVCSLFLIDEGTDPDKLDNTSPNNNINNKNNYNNNKVKLYNIINAYYNNKDYDSFKKAITDIALTETEENKKYLRAILMNAKQMNYNQIKQTEEYKKLID